MVPGRKGRRPPGNETLDALPGRSRGQLSRGLGIDAYKISGAYAAHQPGDMAHGSDTGRGTLKHCGIAEITFTELEPVKVISGMLLT